MGRDETQTVFGMIVSATAPVRIEPDDGDHGVFAPQGSLSCTLYNVYA